MKSPLDNANRHSTATEMSMIQEKRITSKSKQKQDALSHLLRPKVVKQSKSFVTKPHRDRSITSMEIKKDQRLNLRSIIAQESQEVKPVLTNIHNQTDSPE